MKSYKRQNHGDGEQAPTVGPRENRSLTVGPGRRIGLQKWPGTLCGMVACCVSHLSLVAPWQHTCTITRIHSVSIKWSSETHSNVHALPKAEELTSCEHLPQGIIDNRGKSPGKEEGTSIFQLLHPQIQPTGKYYRRTIDKNSNTTIKCTSNLGWTTFAWHFALC